jgi:ferrous iron transport protein B
MIPQLDEIKVLFVGQPNVGKSSLLNALVGPKIEVSNYPGTSVEMTSAAKFLPLEVTTDGIVEKVKFVFTDTPGIYSLSDHSPEETITKKTLISTDYDVIVLILDATNLERGLYFALQTLDLGKKMLIGLNFVEISQKKGINIDIEKLEKILGADVVPFNPITGNIHDLVASITAHAIEDRKQIDSFGTIYDDHIEELIDNISERIIVDCNERFASLRILEEDDDFLSLLSTDQLALITKDIEYASTKKISIKEEISKTRFNTATYIAEQVTELKKPKKEKSDKPFFDRVLLHRVWGPVSTLLFFAGIFFVLLYLGGFIEEGLITLGDLLIDFIPEDRWLVGSFSFLNLIREGLLGVTAGVAIALPYVFLFYIILGITEDIGLLPRFVLNIAKFFEFLGLPSRGFIPMILNIGCTVPAISSTRIIKRNSDRIKVAFMFAFIPCSSRIAIILGVVGSQGGMLVALAVVGTLIIGLLIWALLVKLFWKSKPEPLLIELPSYKRPLLKNVFAKSWIRMKDFITVVIPLLALGGIVFSILDQLSVTSFFIAPFEPITQFLFGLPGVTIIPILFGFIQKDLTGSMLYLGLQTAGVAALTNLQLYTFGLVTCIGIPCIIALGMVFKEFKFKKTLAIFAPPAIYGLIIASTVWRIVSLFM